jgi:hypothetical protein
VNRKTIPAGRVTIKNADEGLVEAVFATLGVIDKDGDVITKGAIPSGDKVTISAYGHKSWEGALPVGMGTITEVGDEAIVSAKFFMDTDQGADTYRTVKGLGELGEWSFGFDILESENGQHDGKGVRVLKSLRIFEVSPVLQGAGIGTHTVAMKGAPCPACGRKDPDMPGADENENGECAECGKVLAECECDHMHSDDDGDAKAAASMAVLHYEVTRAKTLGVQID